MMSSIIILDERSFFEKLRKTIREEINLVLSEDRTPNVGPIELAMKVTGLKKNTIYSMVSKKEIPYYKNGKKLYFKKDELVEWILKERKNTHIKLFDEHTQKLLKRISR